jgi:hypothetical protein
MPEQEPQVGQAILLEFFDFGVGDIVIGGGDHGIDQVERRAARRRY